MSESEDYAAASAWMMLELADPEPGHAEAAWNAIAADLEDAGWLEASDSDGSGAWKITLHAEGDRDGLAWLRTIAEHLEEVLRLAGLRSPAVVSLLVIPQRLREEPAP